MMFRALTVIALLFGAPAIGAPIKIKSGAHDGFARLVLNIPRGSEWSFSNTSSGSRITLPNHTDGFDVSQVFTRIDRSLISAVVPTGSSFDIEFSCTCTAEVFVQDERLIVIDVSESAESEPTVQSANLSDYELKFVGSRQFSFNQPEPTEAAESIPQVASRISIEPIAPPVSPLPAPSTTPTAPDLTAELDYLRASEEGLETDANIGQLLQARKKLAERLGRAATRGVLNPSQNVINLPSAETPPQIDTSIFDSSSPDHEQSTALVGGNLRITSSSDIPLRDSTAQLTSTTLGVRCIDPKHVAVQNWSSEFGFAHRISSLRGQLYSEFDRIDTKVAVELTKLYLHYGFGAEARQILLMIDDRGAEIQALSDLANIMEYGFVPQSNFLENFLDCDTEAALWAILAVETIAASRTVNYQAALRALSALPIHLRKFIAPELSRRLLAYGEKNAASAALRSLERTADPLSPNANLAKADIELAQGDTENAQDRLTSVVNSNAEQSAVALIKLVESRLEAEAVIDEDVATLVQAYAMELRDDPIGPDLQRAHVLALAQSGQFTAGFEAMARVRDRKNSQIDEGLRSSVLNLLAKNADDLDFLNHVFEEMDRAVETVDPRTRSRLAYRLVALGFPSQAKIFLDAGNGVKNTTDAKLLRARIALDLSQPQEALAHLFRVDGNEADELRAEAKAASGEFDDSYAIYSRIGDETNSQRTAWLADDWPSMIDQDTPVLGQIAQVALNPLDDRSDLDGMLGRTSEAISESREARQALEALLELGRPGNDLDR
jgi:hypothetical protein